MSFVFSYAYMKADPRQINIKDEPRYLMWFVSLDPKFGKKMLCDCQTGHVMQSVASNICNTHIP